MQAVLQQLAVWTSGAAAPAADEDGAEDDDENDQHHPAPEHEQRQIGLGHKSGDWPVHPAEGTKKLARFIDRKIFCLLYNAVCL